MAHIRTAATLTALTLALGATAQPEPGLPSSDLDGDALRAAAAAESRGDDTPLHFDHSDVSLDLGILMQYRYTASFAPEAADPADDPAVGFSFRRLRPKMTFRALDDKLTLLFQAEGSGTSLRLLDAVVTYRPTDWFAITAGQFHLKFSREMAVSASHPLAVERSALANTLNPDVANRLQGIQFDFKGDRQRGFVTFSEGLGVANTNYNDETADWGITGRYEALVIGDTFKPFKFHTAPHGTPQGLLFGAGAHAQHLDGLGERVAFVADLAYQNDGFNAMVEAGMLIAEDRNDTTINEPEHQYGFVAQAGQYVTDKVEPFVRGEYGFTSGDHPDLQLITAGFNYYFYGQAVKFTADASYAFDGVGPAHDRGSDGLLQAADDINRYVLRAQIQLIF